MYYKIRLLNNFIKIMTVILLVSLSSVGYSQEKDVNILIKKLNDEDALVRSKAAHALRAMGTSAIEPLIAALKDKDAAVRGKAAYAFYKIKDARAVEPLIAALKNKDAAVRGNAAYALGEIKDA